MDEIEVPIEQIKSSDPWSLAIGVLTRKKFFFYIGSGSGLVGVTAFISFFFIK